MFSPLIRAPPNATSHPRAACWASKTFSLCTSGGWHRVGKAGGGKGGWESAWRARSSQHRCWHWSVTLLLAPLILQFTPISQSLSRPLAGPAGAAAFPLFCPHLVAVPVFWATLKLPAPRTEVPFSSHFFLLKARLPYHPNHCHTTPR